jgi:hypothetical protein
LPATLAGLAPTSAQRGTDAVAEQALQEALAQYP